MNLIKYYNNISEHIFIHIENNSTISSIYYNIYLKEWFITFYIESQDIVKIYNITNIINLTPEQYFQESLVWDYPFPFEPAYDIINKVYNNNNNFNMFFHNQFL